MFVSRLWLLVIALIGMAAAAAVPGGRLPGDLGRSIHNVTLMARELGHTVYQCDEMSQHDYDHGGKQRVIAWLRKEISNYHGDNFMYDLMVEYLADVSPDMKCTGGQPCHVSIDEYRPLRSCDMH